VELVDIYVFSIRQGEVSWQKKVGHDQQGTSTYRYRYDPSHEVLLASGALAWYDNKILLQASMTHLVESIHP
jgi:hypothetical protein